jgi:hypothetical protein
LFINQSTNQTTTNINSCLFSQPTYGNRSDNTHLSAEDAERIDLSIFDEADPWQHMMKIMFGCGIYCMFRSKEHAFFNVNQVKFGHYPRTYEYPGLAGQPYVSINNLTDKSHRITVNNNHARQTSEFLRFSINRDDPADWGASTERYMQKLAPGQTRMYCKPASQSYINSTYRRHGNNSSIFYPNTPLGINKITALMVEGARILGIPHNNFRPHALRAVGITNLANNSSISDAERCRAARHSTVNANRVYQTVDGRSEANRLIALGVNIPTALPPPPDVRVVPPIPQQEGHPLPPSNVKTVSPKFDETEILDVSSPAARATHSDTSICSYGSDPSLSIFKKDKKSEHPGTPSMTQVGLESLQAQFNLLEGLMRGKSDSVKTEKGEALSATQVGIKELEERIGCLQGMMQLKSDKKPPAMSENQIAIKKLEKKVKGLMDEIEHKDLYCDSLENDFFGDYKNKNTDLEDILYQKRILERENRELLDFINRDKKRGKRRKYNRY